MWWAIGIAIWLVLGLVTIALCRTAALGDRRSQAALRKFEAERESRTQKRPAA
ncbi:MAG: hypothetical protein JO065_15175 [Acidobacteria bacterium]|nr:hypothetical protein [Acidobacteriota bacterium]MBV9436949.1 hypothetical protein [Acidobacteriota bacterium]